MSVVSSTCGLVTYIVKIGPFLIPLKLPYRCIAWEWELWKDAYKAWPTMTLRNRSFFIELSLVFCECQWIPIFRRPHRRERKTSLVVLGIEFCRQKRTNNNTYRCFLLVLFRLWCHCCEGALRRRMCSEKEWIHSVVTWILFVMVLQKWRDFEFGDKKSSVYCGCD